MTTRERFDHTITIVSGMIIGAAAMYILDEGRGARRRAQARDRVTHAARVLGRTFGKRSRDLVHRATGAVAELRSVIRDRNAAIPDDILVSRVRAQLGHVVSHPGLLEITAQDGCVLVHGAVPVGEIEKIRKRIARTRGVRGFRVEAEPRADLQEFAGRRGGPAQEAI